MSETYKVVSILSLYQRILIYTHIHTDRHTYTGHAKHFLFVKQNKIWQ